MRKKLFHGWINVAVVWLTYCMTLTTITYAFGIIGPDMADYFGVGLTAASGGFTAYLLCSALCSPLVGKTIDRIGPKNSMLLGCGMLALGSALMAFAVKGMVLYYLVYALLISFSIRTCSLMAPQSLMTKWFFKKRSFAMSLVLTASGVGAYIFNPMMRGICNLYGWRGVWVFQAVCAGFCFVLVLLFLRDDPAKMGQLVDNGEVTEKLSRGGESRVYKTRDSWHLSQALREPAFYALLIIALAAFYAMNAVSNSGVAHLSGRGVDADAAAKAVGYFALVNVIGRLIVGYLSDRINMKWLIFAGGLAGLGGCLLMRSASTAEMGYAALILAGIGYALMFVTPQTLLVDYFGTKYYADINGLFNMLTSGIAASSPVLIGLSFDLAGDYRPAWLAAALLFLAGTVCAALMRPPRLGKEKAGEEQA